MSYFSSVVNNPRRSWTSYLGLPEDLDDFTLEDVRSSVSAYVAPAADVTSMAVPIMPGHTITMADFKEYMRHVGDPYAFMAANRPFGVPEACEPTAAVAGCDAERAEALKQVPEVCFQEEFELADPGTFAHFSPPDRPYASRVTLEKLQGYLDTVELTLLAEVSLRSDGFFEALASYEHLQGEVAAGCAQIEALRSTMRALEANLVHKSLRLPVLARRRANTHSLLEKLRLVHAVWATQPMIQQQLTARDFPTALDLISSSQQLLATELCGISSLRKLGTPPCHAIA